jgi:hypothetical protein
MTTDTDSKPWMDCDWQDSATLTGNRAGFEALRGSIDRLLNSGKDIVSVDPKILAIQCLVLKEALPEALPAPSRIGNLVGALGALTAITIFLSIPIFAYFGLLQFLRWIFS